VDRHNCTPAAQLVIGQLIRSPKWTHRLMYRNCSKFQKNKQEKAN